MESLKGRVCLLTGGGSGIGRITCFELIKHGCKVSLSDINEEEAQRTVSLIKEKEAEVTSIKCDVSSSESVAAMVKHTIKLFGRLDFAVNCAGVIGKLNPIAKYQEDVFDIMVKVNLKGVYLCMKHEIDQILKQEKSNHYSIVNVSSIAGVKGFKLNAPYAAVKHGVIGMTKSTALDYARSGIRVNAVCPASIATPMFSETVGGAETQLAERVKKSIPMGRVGTPEEVAASILWLLSGASSFTTGAAILTDGGLAAL